MPTYRRVRSLRQPRPVNALRIPLRQRLKVTNSLPRKKKRSNSSQPDGTQERSMRCAVCGFGGEYNVPSMRRRQSR